MISQPQKVSIVPLYTPAEGKSCDKEFTLSDYSYRLVGGGRNLALIGLSDQRGFWKRLALESVLVRELLYG